MLLGMGMLVSHEYDVAEGQEYVVYLERVLGECRRLREEGRLPEGDNVDGFLDDVAVVMHEVRRDVGIASAQGRTRTRSEVRMSDEEHKRITSMSESVRNLLEILELRKALVLDRTPGIARVADALLTGTYTA